MLCILWKSEWPSNVSVRFNFKAALKSWDAAINEYVSKTNVSHSQRYNFFFAVHMSLFYSEADWEWKMIHAERKSYIKNCLSKRGLSCILKCSSSQLFRTTFKLNLTCIFLSLQLFEKDYFALGDPITLLTYLH